MAVETGTFVVSPGSTKTSFNIQSKPGMAPTARLLVYCTKNDGEVVVDTLNVKIDDPFQNQVRIFKWLVVHVMYSLAMGDRISTSERHELNILNHSHVLTAVVSNGQTEALNLSHFFFSCS